MGEVNLWMVKEQPDELFARIPGRARDGDPNFLHLCGLAVVILAFPAGIRYHFHRKWYLIPVVGRLTASSTGTACARPFARTSCAPVPGGRASGDPRRAGSRDGQ